MTTKLNEDRARAEWLQCLQAAAALVADESLSDALSDEGVMAPTRITCVVADALFAELRRRCET